MLSPLKAILVGVFDLFEIRCGSGNFVWVIFSLECHDLEVIRWVASSVRVNGELVRALGVVNRQWILAWQSVPAKDSISRSRIEYSFG
jgi:hypothetical protein